MMLLIDSADAAAHLSEFAPVERRQIAPGKVQQTARRSERGVEETKQSRLARARSADQCDLLASLYVERETVERDDRPFTRMIMFADAVERVDHRSNPASLAACLSLS